MNKHAKSLRGDTVRPSVTMMIPAYNEEEHLKITYDITKEVLEKETQEYEIIIINDGSTDKTGEIAESIAKTDPNVITIHQKQNMGFGPACRAALSRATKEYTGWIPADTFWAPSTLKMVISLLGDSDIVTTYTIDTSNRPLSRRMISRLYTLILNLLFGLKMKYYNGPCIHKTRLLKSITLKSQGFTIWAEAILNLVTAGHSCHQVEAFFEDRKFGKSKAFRLSNIIGTFRIVCVLIWDIYVQKKRVECKTV